MVQTHMEGRDGGREERVRGRRMAQTHMHLQEHMRRYKSRKVLREKNKSTPSLPDVDDSACGCVRLFPPAAIAMVAILRSHCSNRRRPTPTPFSSRSLPDGGWGLLVTMATRADWGLPRLPWVTTEVVVAGVTREGKTAAGLMHASDISPSPPLSPSWMTGGGGGGEAAGVYTPLSRVATGAKTWHVVAEIARVVGVATFDESARSLFAQR